MSLSPAFLDELKARTSLNSLIAKSVKLVKAGREMKGCCPFHSEKSPSFYVNDDKGFYHCFGCSAHGDAVRWLTDHDALPFMDAVKQLAAAAGMEMPPQDPRHASRDREQAEMLDIMDRAARFYADQIRTDGGRTAREYVTNRQITNATEFGIGWAPGGRADDERLHVHLKDVAIPKLVTLGLVKLRDGTDEPFDFFRNRVIFPIADQRGRVIGFGGRVLGDQQPKYLNSPDTPVFDKGRTLYNLHRAGPAARAAKRLLVVEGYMDVIGLARAGVDEVVAPNGTALTEAQIARLWRVCETPILCFDGDKAGQAAAALAAIRALPLLEPDHSLSFVTPPDGQDPDDVAKGGRAAVDAMLERPKPLVEVLWEHELAAGPTDTPEQKAGLGKRLRDHAGTIRNQSVARAYLDDFRARYEAHTARAVGPRRAPMSDRTTRNNRAVGDGQFARREKPQTDQSKAIGRGGVAQNIERAVLTGLLNYPQMICGALESVSGARFTNDHAAALRDALFDAAVEDQPFSAGEEFAGAVAFARSGPLRFTFTTEGADEAQAIRDLTDALDQLRR